MSVCDRNDPRITGAPGLISWVERQPGQRFGRLLDERGRHRGRRHRAHQEERR